MAYDVYELDKRGYCKLRIEKSKKKNELAASAAINFQFAFFNSQFSILFSALPHEATSSIYPESSTVVPLY
jgi:hypothetical protein